jgi:hypothetical protein
LILPLAAQYKHKAKLHDFKKPANSAVAIALSSVAPMHAASNTAAKVFLLFFFFVLICRYQ